MRLIKIDNGLLIIEGILLGGGMSILLIVGYGKLCWPAFLFYAALRMAIIEAIKDILDDKIRELKQ